PNSARPQNGYAEIDISAAIELRPAARIPNQRPNSPPAQIEKAANSSITAMIRTIQPHVFSPLRMYVVSCAKNFELLIAAIPQITFRPRAIEIMIRAKPTQPTPASLSSIVASDGRCVAPTRLPAGLTMRFSALLGAEFIPPGWHSPATRVDFAWAPRTHPYRIASRWTRARCLREPDRLSQERMRSAMRVTLTKARNGRRHER